MMSSGTKPADTSNVAEPAAGFENVASSVAVPSGPSATTDDAKSGSTASKKAWPEVVPSAASENVAGVPAGEFGAAVSRIVAGVWGVPMEMSAKPPSDAVSVKPAWLTLSIDAVRSASVAAATRIGECVVKSQPI